MIRTVPETTGEGIELYIRTYYSLLRSSGDIRIRSLEETHEGMFSSLHLKAESPEFDASAFTYAAFRLPDCLHQVRRVVMGQADEVFVRHGLRDIATWQRVDAAARRRRMLFDGQETLAAFVSSVSDIDDLVPILTAYQIEWNKMHDLIALLSGGDAPTTRPQQIEPPRVWRATLGVSDVDFGPASRGARRRRGRCRRSPRSHGASTRPARAPARQGLVPRLPARRGPVVVARRRRVYPGRGDAGVQHPVQFVSSTRSPAQPCSPGYAHSGGTS